MDPKLTTDNRYVTMEGIPLQVMRRLEKATSYLVAGYKHSSAYKSRRWDGRQHLITFSKKHGYRAPIGLLSDICSCLDADGLSYSLDAQKRTRRFTEVHYEWNPDLNLREYQQEAVDAIYANEGSGLLNMAIRSGKTMTAAAIIARLKARTLFVVPSQQLLHQTHSSLKRSLPDACITKIGDGLWDTSGDIVVATVQSITAASGGLRVCKGNISGIGFKDRPASCGKKQCSGGHRWRKIATSRYRELCNSFDLLIFDEAHHLRGDAWHGVVMEFSAIYRIGLSATIFLDHDRETERGAIWLKACCGDVVYKIGSSRLIELGFLMRQEVELVQIRKPDLHNRRWSKSLQDEAIFLNSYRNAICALKAKEKVDLGLKVLIVSRRHAQVNMICMMLNDIGVAVEPVTGKESSQKRSDLIYGFTEGYTQALVGTVFGEGLDIPEVEVVINAEGGRDIKSTIQRQRNLTISDGKERAILIDMMDLTNEYFATHSMERKDAYCSEPAYVVHVAHTSPEMESEAEGLAAKYAGYSS